MLFLRFVDGGILSEVLEFGAKSHVEALPILSGMGFAQVSDTGFSRCGTQCGLEKIDYAVAESSDRQGGTVDAGV